MSTQRLIACYLLMLVAHVAHVFEGILGRFWLMEQVYGEGWFLLVNWVLFCVPVVLFYSIVVPEFGGIDHLPDALTALIRG